MPSAKFLGAPLEGTAPVGDLEWWCAQAKSATPDEQCQTIEKNRERLSAFANAFRPHYYVSCWHMNALENTKMWQCYTKTSEAVAVTTSYQALRASLPAYVEIGMVRYIDYTNERLPSLNMFEYITHKNINFCFEREVRAVTLPPAAEGLGTSNFRDNHFESETHNGFLVFAPEIDISSLIHSVVLHPESPSEFTERIHSACENAGLPKPIRSAFSSQGTSLGSRA